MLSTSSPCTAPCCKSVRDILPTDFAVCRYRTLFSRKWNVDCPGYSTLGALVEASANIMPGAAHGGDRWFHSLSNPPDDDVELPRRADVDVDDEDDGYDAETAVAAVRAQILALLSTEPEGMLGARIPVAYKERYGVSWKEACRNAVQSLSVLLDTPQFRRVKGASGTDSCFFVAASEMESTIDSD